MDGAVTGLSAPGRFRDDSNNVIDPCIVRDDIEKNPRQQRFVLVFRCRPIDAVHLRIVEAILHHAPGFFEHLPAFGDHVDFHLSPDQGIIGLSDSDLTLIDCVIYGPQRTDISQGLSPNGGTNYAFFTVATPGSPNPAPSGTRLIRVPMITALTRLKKLRRDPWKNIGGIKQKLPAAAGVAKRRSA